ncbi:hypothetical protein H8958_018114 [Nasalis larvatus]
MEIAEDADSLRAQERENIIMKYEKQMRREITRKSKWMEMLGQWETYKNSTKLIDRVYKGIPMNIRGQVWSVLLNIPEVQSKNPRTYKVMKEKGKRLSEHIHQIDLDMSGTLRTHIFFRDRYGAKQRELFYIPLAYSEYNPFNKKKFLHIIFDRANKLKNKNIKGNVSIRLIHFSKHY